MVTTKEATVHPMLNVLIADAYNAELRRRAARFQRIPRRRRRTRLAAPRLHTDS